MNVISKQRSQAMEDAEILFLVWLNGKQLAGDSACEAIIDEQAR